MLKFKIRWGLSHEFFVKSVEKFSDLRVQSVPFLWIITWIIASNKHAYTKDCHSNVSFFGVLLLLSLIIIDSKFWSSGGFLEKSNKRSMWEY